MGDPCHESGEGLKIEMQRHSGVLQKGLEGAAR